MWQPPSIEFGDDFPPPTLPSELIPAFAVGPYRIALDETPIEEVAKHFDAQIGHSGDASEFVQWICLYGSDTLGHWALWIDSGEINGGNVGGFTMMRLGPERRTDPRCRSVRLDVTNPAGLRLGMTQQEVQQTIGTPSGVVRGTSLYLYEGDGPGGSTIASVIAVVFRDGVIERFSVANSGVF